MRPIADASFRAGEGGRLTFFWVAEGVTEAEDRLCKLTEGEVRRTRDTWIIKENRYRAIYRVKLPFLKGAVLVKAFRFPTLPRLVKGYFQPYALKEWRHAREALARGVPVPVPLFLVRRRWGVKTLESLLGYRFLEGSSLYAYLSVKETLPYYRRLQLLRSAGQFTAVLHNKGGIHKDYHAGNLLVLKNASIALVDLYPLRFVKEMGEEDRIDGLAQLVASLIPVVGKAGIDELLDGYREASEVPLSAGAEDAIMARQWALQRRHEASRAKRCMRNSSEFYQVRSSEARIAARREMTPDALFSLLKSFDQQYRSHPESALKNAPESVILRLTRENAPSLCVKWYRRRGWLDQIKESLRGGRALRAWKAGNGLRARGIPVATPLAMVQTSKGGYLFMEEAEGVELDRMLSRILELRGAAIWKIKCQLAETLGHLIGNLHRKGIFHADLKACNIMVAEEGERLRVKLLDYDHVTFRKQLPLKLALKNLVQLNGSLPRAVSRSLRLRFLRAYVGNCPEAPHEKELFRMVWEASMSLPIVYVTHQGDRMESWQS